MLNKSLIALVFGSLLTLAGAAAVANPPAANSPEATIIERLQQARPDIEFGAVRPSPVKGLYQVQVVGGPVLYVTPEGDMFIAGDLFSIDESGFGRVEDPYLLQARKAMLASIDPATAISYKPSGETKAVVYVFTDVDCGFCRRLHSHIHAYKEQGVDKPGYGDLGIEIRYLAYPRSGLNSPSSDKLITAWCSADRQKAMDRLKNLQAVAPIKCDDNPVATQYHLGGEMGVSGTPALLLTDGSMIGGYLPPEELAKRLGL